MRGGLCPAGPEPIYSQGREGGSPGQRTPVLPSSLFSGLAGSWNPAQCREQGHQRNTGASVVSAACMGGGDMWGGLFTRSPSPQDVMGLWWRGREALLRAGKLFCPLVPTESGSPSTGREAWPTWGWGGSLHAKALCSLWPAGPLEACRPLGGPPGEGH